MEFELLLLKMNEIIHKLISKYKEEIIESEDFRDITMSSLFYIEAIHQLSNPTISELANHLQFSKASTTNAIKKLIVSEVVAKVQSSEDKRSCRVCLTESGESIIQMELKALADIGSRMRIVLSEEEVILTTEVLKKIIDSYK